MLKTNCFKNGCFLAVTLSYDDGIHQDRRLVEIMNRYGVRGTFHLNSKHVTNDDEGHIHSEELPKLYAGHEVAVHCVTHPVLPSLPNEGVVQEVLEDRKTLEKCCGYPVRGMSYPFGAYDERVISLIKNCGIVYSRAVQTTNNFGLPNNFMKWEGTCHHNGNLLELADKFLKTKDDRWKQHRLLYVWGHSYEFDNDNNWDMIEAFCEKIGNKDYIWYATNIEIYDYIKAMRSLCFSVDCSMVYNPSALSIWVDDNGKLVEVKPGDTYCEQNKQ